MQFCKLTLQGLPVFRTATEFQAQKFSHEFIVFENLFEITLLKEGVCVREDGNNRQKIMPHSLNYEFKDFSGRYFSDAYSRHSSIVVSLAYEYEWLDSATMSYKELEDVKNSTEKLDTVLLCKGELNDKEYAELNKKIKQFIRIFDMKKITAKTELLAMWFDILSHLNSMCINKILPRYKHPLGVKYCEAACRYISRNLYAHIKVSDIADDVQISENYLQTVFKKVMHVSIIDYINSLKLEKAKYYFANTSYSVADVAEMFGFKDAGYFGRLFRAAYKMSIREFRAMAKSVVNTEDA